MGFKLIAFFVLLICLTIGGSAGAKQRAKKLYKQATPPESSLRLSFIELNRKLMKIYKHPAPLWLLQTLKLRRSYLFIDNRKKYIGSSGASL
jgi:hypothetical protein